MLFRLAAVSVVTSALLAPMLARAEDSAVLPPDSGASPAREARVTGHGDVLMTGGAGSWTTSMPFASLATPDRNGDASGGAMSIAVAGRHAGFLLSLTGDASTNASAPMASSDQRYGTGGALFAITASLHAGDALVMSIGPAVEAHATAVATVDPTGDAVAGWQGVVGGGAAHLRLMMGPHAAILADGFAGVAPVSGRWQVVDTQSNQTLSRGNLTEPMIGAGSLALALRPGEHVAISAGVAARDASWRIDASTLGHERALRPFVGIGLVW